MPFTQSIFTNKPFFRCFSFTFIAYVGEPPILEVSRQILSALFFYALNTPKFKQNTQNPNVLERKLGFRHQFGVKKITQ